MLINISNHPKRKWSVLQLTTAERDYGEVYDLPFPNIDPRMKTEDVEIQAMEYYRSVLATMNTQKAYKEDTWVFVMGEMCFVVALVGLLKNKGFKVIHATSERYTSEGYKDGFNFHSFREY